MPSHPIGLNRDLIVIVESTPALQRDGCIRSSVRRAASPDGQQTAPSDGHADPAPTGAERAR